MAGWGANVAADDVPVVSAYLAASYGPDAGSYQVARIAVTSAPREIERTADSLYGGGNVDRGGSLFAATCAACHGTDARGQIGVNLVDRPLLYRASEFADVIFKGRPTMPALPSMPGIDVADILAYLRRVRPVQ